MTTWLADGFAGSSGYAADAAVPAGAAQPVAAHAVPAMPRRVPSFRFSTAELPPEERFPAWRTSHAAALDLRRPDGGTAFAGGAHEVWDLGSLVFVHARTASVGFAGLAGTGRQEPLDHWMLTLLVSGRSVTTAGGEHLVGEAGTVQMHPLGRRFDGWLSDSELMLLFVPRDLCRDTTRILDAAAFTRLDGGMGRLFADYMKSLALRLPLLRPADLPELVAATRALLVACASPSPERLAAADGAVSTLLLERARQYVNNAHLQDPGLGPCGMARALGISRSRLYRLFEASGGVMHYVQRRRLAAAHAALADPLDHRHIFEIAQSYCFGDGAEFSRAFRRARGCSPSDVRAGRSRGLPGVPAATPAAAPPSERLNALLRHLQG